MAAFLVITYLTWAAITVSGTTPEISSTIGDTVNIPCPFGEGTVSNIFWYYNDGTGRHNILFLRDGNLHKEAEYANRASLQDDFSTLILKDITVADAGTYHCVVDRQRLTVVTNITTKLNVFSLRPDTLPVISPCTGADESPSCSIHTNQLFTLTCTLPNVYPVEDTELIWYQDGKRVSSIHDFTQNDDGTTDISRQIQVSKTGNFTCNATYLSANGSENTAVSVKAWVIPPADVPNTPGNNMTSSPIDWKTMCIVLIVVISMAIIALFLYFWKSRGQRFFKRDENKLDETELNQVVSSDSVTSSSVRHRNVNRTNLSSLDILERFIKSGLHQNGIKRARWPSEKTVVCLIGYQDNSRESVIKHTDSQDKEAEGLLLEYINSNLDKTKIKCITVYINYSSGTQWSGELQILKREIPDLQIKFSAFYYIRRQSCTESCHCRTTDPDSFKMLRKLEARPFQKDDWKNLINLLREDDEKKGHPTSDLDGLRYGHTYGVWRNEEDERMLADFQAAVRECQRT